MKYFKIIIIFFTIAFFNNMAIAESPVRMGYFILAPHQYVEEENSKPRGASIAYFETMASRMNVKVEWVGPLPLIRLSEFLKNGEVDGTVGFNKFSGLAEFLYYTNTPIYFAQPTLLVLRGNSLKKIRTIEDIRGFHIGLGVSILKKYTPMIDEHRDVLFLEEIAGNDWISQNLEKLILGRTDAFFDRQPYTPLFVAAKLGLMAQIRGVPIPDPPTPMYTAFSKASKRARELLDLYNYAGVPKNLNYEQLLQKEFELLAEQK